MMVIAMPIPSAQKRSVALAIRPQYDGSRVLLVRRPDDDDEFPGAWGLPAATCIGPETLEEAAQRIGQGKLGVEVRLGEVIGFGVQDRDDYVIEMHLFEARLHGTAPTLVVEPRGSGLTHYTSWRWGEPSDLVESAGMGSLCGRLLLEATGVIWDPCSEI